MVAETPWTLRTNLSFLDSELNFGARNFEDSPEAHSQVAISAWLGTAPAGRQIQPINFDPHLNNVGPTEWATSLRGFARNEVVAVL